MIKYLLLALMLFGCEDNTIYKCDKGVTYKKYESSNFSNYPINVWIATHYICVSDEKLQDDGFN